MGLRGELACFGVHIDALPGATLVAKHKHFCELDASEWHKPVVNSGFHYKLTEEAVYVLPPGPRLLAHAA